MSRAARVRCGACDRVLWAPDARRGWDREAQQLHHALEARRGGRTFLDAVADREYSEAEVEVLLALRHGRGRPALAKTATHRWDPAHGIVERLTCRCGVSYAVPGAAMGDRRLEAKMRGEDVILTAADRRRGDGA